jgi:hypothetical protein
MNDLIACHGFTSGVCPGLSGLRAGNSGNKTGDFIACPGLSGNGVNK